MRPPPRARAPAQRPAPARPSPQPLHSKVLRQGIRALSSAVWWPLAPSHWHCVSNAGAPKQRTNGLGDQRCEYKRSAWRRTRWSFSFLAYMLRLDFINSHIYLPIQSPARLRCRDSSLHCSALLCRFPSPLWPLVYSPSLCNEPSARFSAFCHYWYVALLSSHVR